MKVFKSRIVFLFSMLVLSMSLSQCSCSDVVGSLFVSEADEQRLGLQFDNDLKNSPSKYPVSNNGEMRAYVQKVFDDIKAAVPKDEMPSYGFQPVKLIDDPNTANAFAVPGGYVYVYTGILKSMEDEAELAAVLGHEITHVTHHHYRNQLAKQYGVQTLVTLLGGDSTMVSSVAQGLLSLKFSRDDEFDADKGGTLLAGTAGWNARGVATFFERMPTTGMPEVFSTHPDAGDRVVAIFKYIRSVPSLAALTWSDDANSVYRTTNLDRNGGSFAKYKALVK